MASDTTGADAVRASSVLSRLAIRSCVMAARIARIRSDSLSGLVRKSTAPAFIARTDLGMSPCPVMKTIWG